jgi:hypothetical protein
MSKLWFIPEPNLYLHVLILKVKRGSGAVCDPETQPRIALIPHWEHDVGIP